MKLSDFYSPEPLFPQINGVLPAAYRNTIVCGDCCDVLRRIPDNCIDLIVTSPPYNFGLEYDRCCDTLSWQRFFTLLKDVLNECIRVPLFSGQLPTHHILSHYLLSEGMIWKAEILWDKHNYNCRYCTWGAGGVH